MIVALMEVQIADFEGHGAYTSVLEWYLGSLIQTIMQNILICQFSEYQSKY